MNPLLPTKCPTCRKAGNWLEGKFAPFCSQRCKLIDLGGWFNEKHVIATPLRPESLADYSQLPPGPQVAEPEQNPRD